MPQMRSPGSRHLDTIQATLSAGAFVVAAFAYVRWIPNSILFPLDAVVLALLVFSLDLPRLSTGETLKLTQRLPSVAFAIILYAGLRYQDSSILVFTLVSMTIAWTGSLVWLNRSVDWLNVRTRLRKRLQTAIEAAKREDPVYDKKRVSVFWGLITGSGRSFVTLGVLTYPVGAGYIGVMLLVAVISMLEQWASIALLVTPVLFLWSVAHIRRPRRALHEAGLLQRLATAWDMKEDREDLIARGIVRSLFTPIGLLSFIIMCACVFLAIVGIMLMGSFLASGFHMFTVSIIDMLVLLSSFCVAVLLFPGYLGFCLFLHICGRKMLHLPAFTYLWLCFCLGIMLAMFSPLNDVVMSILSRAGLQVHLFPAISLASAFIIASNIAAECRPITKFNQHILLAGLSPIIFLLFWFGRSGLGTDFYLGLLTVALLLFGITFIMQRPVDAPVTGRTRIGAVFLSLAFLVATVYFAAEEMIVIVPVTLATWVLTLYFFSAGKRSKRILKAILGMREELVES